MLFIFLLFFFAEIEKENKQVIQSPEPNQPEFNWFGLVRIWSKKFMNPNQTKPIKINWFGFIFPPNPIRTNPFTPLARTSQNIISSFWRVLLCTPLFMVHYAPVMWQYNT